MNKQEALEAVLRKVRAWEEPGNEVRATDPVAVGEELLASARAIDLLVAQAESEDADEAFDIVVFGEHLLTVAAAAVYLLVDEVTVVEPLSPSHPLTAGPAAIPATVTINPASYDPTPVNGYPPGIRELVAERLRLEGGRG